MLFCPSLASQTASFPPHKCTCPRTRSPNQSSNEPEESRGLFSSLTKL